MSRRRSVRWLIRGLLAAAIVGAAGEMALRRTPFPEALQVPPRASAEFVDRTGRPLRRMLVEDRHYTQHAAISQISPALIEATLSAEDQRFRRHGGVDALAVLRAAWTASRGRTPASGASTITQQLVKLASPGPRTISTKLREIWLAMRVERTWGKERILVEYLNRLDYGNLQVGIAAASWHYFGKPPIDLSIAEAAFLAGLPKAPTRLNPHADPAPARERQRWILKRMLATGRISGSEFTRSAEEALHLEAPGSAFAAPHFVDLLLQRRGIISPEGGEIRTTLDLDLNRFVERVISEQLAKIVDKHATSAAAVVLHNPTGEVLALAGSGDYFQSDTGQVNGAWIVRSPGSTVKPFTYLLALENGANPCSIVADVPSEFATPTGLYRPNNYNHRFHGPVSLRFALGNSLNVGAIRTLQIAGGPEALHRRMSDLGITTLGHPAEHYGLGLTLGNGEMRLLELANAFGTLARLGVHQPYRLLKGGEQSSTEGRAVCDRRAAYLIADMLADNSARSAAFGLDSFLAFDFPVACKTGTSSDYRDNWVFGYTPEFTVGVWVGNADGSPMREITGVTGAGPVMHDVFQHLRKTRGTSWFEKPAGITDYRVHPLTGHVLTANNADGIVEQCLWPPKVESPADYDDNGQVLLGPEYRAWAESTRNELGELVSVRASASDLRIVRPVAGTVYFLDADLPESSQWITLQAEANSAVEWNCDSLPLSKDTERRVQIKEGRHVISAREPSTGRTADTWIEVRAL
ncbi:MAG: penicillin-binding protein 1C [Chthoniobacteraceae bacterium]